MEKDLYNLLRHRGFLLLLVFVAGVALILGALPARGGDSNQVPSYVVTGFLEDNQGRPVRRAEIAAYSRGQSQLQSGDPQQPEAGPQPFAKTESQADGSWELVLSNLPADPVSIDIERSHFYLQTVALGAEQLEVLDESGAYNVGELVLDRRISAGFWAATTIFLVMLLLIAFEVVHSVTAALLGLSAVYLVSGIGSVFFPDLYILTFHEGLEYINWEVIFLVMGMMIIIAIIERTGIFQWTAFQTYRLSGGRSWLLVIILMVVTALASALLDNFTTMLLMTPISLQIGLAIGINPLALVIPEVLASNVGGISTLIGTPTNILIGAYAGISFTDFLVNQTFGVVAAMIVLSVFVLFHYRGEWRKSRGGISPKLYETLEKNARIANSRDLWRSGIVFVFVLAGFIVGEHIDMPPAIPALVGATVLLVWLKPDVHEMISAVDWTTLVFFMALFIVVGAVQEVGLISLVAAGMSVLIGQNLILGIIVIVLGVGTLSTVVTNIRLLRPCFRS